ncbi:hypothetical protein [Amycolatopsis taiwanensis]|nr:hypothetical protein [Amycolatopsis taiwanensis]
MMISNLTRSGEEELTAIRSERHRMAWPRHGAHGSSGLVPSISMQ